MNALFTAKALIKDRPDREIAVRVSEDAEKLTVTIAKAELDGLDAQTLELDSPLHHIPAGEEGYMLYHPRATLGVIMTRFTPREDCAYDTQLSTLPIYAIVRGEKTVFAVVSGMKLDYSLRVAMKDGEYSITPRFILDGDGLYEDVKIEYFKMPGAGYVEMGRKYREIALTRYGCKPLRERARYNPQLAYAAGAMELRIRMCWKPYPTTVPNQTPENEPPLKVVCTFKRVGELLDEMKRQGVEKAEICLVGWQTGGHDGRIPQQYPAEEKLGGDAGLIALIEKAQSMGYQIVCHTNSLGAQTVADNWDWGTVVMNKGINGTVSPSPRLDYPHGLNGGVCYPLCARSAYERYAVGDLPKIRAYGFSGVHYVDELTIVPPYKCHSPEHPVNRREAVEWYRKLAKLTKRLFGGFASEGGNDFFASDLDYALYVSFSTDPRGRSPLFDREVPFWQIAYHGIILSTANSQTVNYPLQDEAHHLKLVEFGGRPLAYYYTRFRNNQKGVWLGDNEMLCDTDEQLRDTVSKLKEMYDEFEAVKQLQYEFIDDHETLSDGVFRTTYSDGTMVTVDYNANTISYDKGASFVK